MPRPVQLTRSEVATIIDEFLSGVGGRWDWDDFCSFPIADPELESIRQRCIGVRDEYPSETGYCGDEGLRVLRGFVAQLRQRAGAAG